MSKQSKRLRAKRESVPAEYILIVGDGDVTEVISFETEYSRNKFIDTIMEYDDDIYFTFISETISEQHTLH